MSTAKIRETKLLFGVGLRRTKFAREFFPSFSKEGKMEVYGFPSSISLKASRKPANTTKWWRASKNARIAGKGEKCTSSGS